MTVGTAKRQYDSMTILESMSQTITSFKVHLLHFWSNKLAKLHWKDKESNYINNNRKQPTTDHHIFENIFYKPNHLSH